MQINRYFSLVDDQCIYYVLLSLSSASFFLCNDPVSTLLRWFTSHLLDFFSDEKIVWKLSLRVLSISQKSADYFWSLCYSLDFPNSIPYHKFSYLLNCLTIIIYSKVQKFPKVAFSGQVTTIFLLKKFYPILHYLLPANATCSGFPDSQAPVPSPLGNCWTVPPANNSTNILNKIPTFNNYFGLILQLQRKHFYFYKSLSCRISFSFVINSNLYVHTEIAVRDWWHWDMGLNPLYWCWYITI